MKKYTLFLAVFILSFTLLGFSNSAFAQALPSDVDPAGDVSSCVSLVNNLRYRSRDANTNGEVSTLQDYLQSKGYLNSEPTGYFGLLTMKAVQAFQKENKINSTGYVGPLTRAKIKALTCGDADPSGSVVISGVSGPQTLKVNEKGTWTVKASSVNGGNLTYSVKWGDEYELTTQGVNEPYRPAPQQSATFTHAYAKAGTYTPTFTVTSPNTINCITTPCPSNEGEAQTSLTVKVEGTSNSYAGELYIEPNTASVKVGGTATLQAMYQPPMPPCPVGMGCALVMPAPYPVHTTWKSSNTGVATVTYKDTCPPGALCGAISTIDYQTAVITGVSKGDAVLTATYNGKAISFTATAKIKVEGGTTSSLPWGCTSNEGYSPLSGYPCFVETSYDATSITSTSAVLHGELLNYAPAKIHFSYGRVTWGEEFFTDTVSQDSNGAFSITLPNLIPSNSYWFRACVSHAQISGFQCARSPSFNTLPSEINPSTPKITSLAPTSGAIGTQVVISGSGFARAGNRINFGKLDALPNSYSSNGTSIIFTVPTYSPITGLPVHPGVYPVSVISVDGTSASESIDFTVIGNTQFSLGDVNADGLIDCTDLTMIANGAAGIITLTADQIKRADMSGNGTVSAYDAALLAKKYSLNCTTTANSGTLSIDPSSVSLVVGGTATLQAMYQPPIPACLSAVPACKIATPAPYPVTATSWTVSNTDSSNTPVASIAYSSDRSSAILTGLSAGTATVSTKYKDSTGAILNASAIAVVENSQITPCLSCIPIGGEEQAVLGAQDFNFTQLLKIGSIGNEVKELQKFLNGAGYDCGTPDGNFGVKTEGALVKFQLANKLTGDGVVGPMVRAILNK